MPTTLIISVAQRPDYDIINNKLVPLNVSGEDALALLMDRAEIGETPKIWVSERVMKKIGGTFWKQLFWVYGTVPSNGGGFNQFDSLTIFTQKQNFFGGALGKTQFEYLLSLAHFQGQIRHYVNDPLFLNYNEVEETHKRMVGPKPLKADFLDEAKYATFRDILGMSYSKGFIDHALSIFPNVVAPINQNLKAHLEFSDVIRLTHEKVRRYSEPVPLSNKTFECVYIGIKRPDRMKKLRSYKKELGNDFQMMGPVAGERMMKTPATIQCYAYSAANVVLGDTEHTNTGLNHRLIQGLSSGSVTFVERALDPNGTLIVDENLRNLLYFDTAEELKKKYDRVTSNEDEYAKIILRQGDELDRIFAERKIDLINRTSVYLQDPKKVI